jgi:hypothetical protein
MCMSGAKTAVMVVGSAQGERNMYICPGPPLYGVTRFTCILYMLICVFMDTYSLSVYTALYSAPGTS